MIISLTAQRFKVALHVLTRRAEREASFDFQRRDPLLCWSLMFASRQVLAFIRNTCVASNISHSLPTPRYQTILCSYPNSVPPQQHQLSEVCVPPAHLALLFGFFAFF